MQRAIKKKEKKKKTRKRERKKKSRSDAFTHTDRVPSSGSVWPCEAALAWGNSQSVHIPVSSFEVSFSCSLPLSDSANKPNQIAPIKFHLLLQCQKNPTNYAGVWSRDYQPRNSRPLHPAERLSSFLYLLTIQFWLWFFGWPTALIAKLQR